MTIPSIAASSAAPVHAGAASHAHRHARPQPQPNQTGDTAVTQANAQRQAGKNATTQSLNLLV